MEEDVNDNFEFEEVPGDGDPRKSNNEKRWRLSHLQAQFKSLALDHLFNRYIERISHGYLSQMLTLQTMLTTTHFFILVFTDSYAKSNLPDHILYGTIALISVVLLILTDTFVKKNPKLLKIFATTAVLMIFFANIFVPLYHIREENLQPAYTTYLLISNYIFLNIQNDLVSVVIGVFISIVHLAALVYVTYDVEDPRYYRQLVVDILYLVCINCLGIHFRYVNEIVIRRTFLDKRSCVEKTHQLKFEEEHEYLLMSSIIPRHILDRVQRDFNTYASETPENNIVTNPFNDLYVDEHPDVSILFADIVNYTVMTTQLNPTDLLDVLNELFGRFDDASEELAVLRIKFLGDCYYCVAGLIPDQAVNHAEACVDLGLKMITIINDIKSRKELNISMRIGVHSGRISGGIIGAIKWQYDIWSVDVDIANKMETEGKSGKVHITKRTKDLLKKPYSISPSRKIVQDQETFLITPEPQTNNLPVVTVVREAPVIYKEVSETDDGQTNKRRSTIFKKNSRGSMTLSSERSSSLIDDYRKLERNQNGDLVSAKRHTFPNSNERRVSVAHLRRPTGNGNIVFDKRMPTSDRKRRTAFMNNNIHRYKERLAATNSELAETIEEMRLSKYEQWIRSNDEMYRLWMIFKDWKSELSFIKRPDHLFKHYLISVSLLLVLVFINQNITSNQWDWSNSFFYVTLFIIVCFLLPMTWTEYFWSKYSEFEPQHKILGGLYKTAVFITDSTLTRTIIYIVLYALFCLTVLYDWEDCPRDQPDTDNPLNPCSNIMTETCALAIIASFMFLRMYAWLKLLCAGAMAVVYTLGVYEFSEVYFNQKQTFNHLLDPKISHVISVIFLTFTLHLVDRQTEYMSRLECLWYQNLVKKEKEANSAHHINTMLLRNILPRHVAELYLNVNRNSSEEVYHENYDDAAIMFASITNFSTDDMGRTFLNIMNAVISDFDEILSECQFGRPIEKIKVAKWTYMAACGLAPGLGNIENIRRDSGTHVVICLLKFAAKLMQQIKQLNTEILQDFKLRIGLCHGFVTAGVVGSKKPLYDVWGDAVNMASRMDTTGLENHIQVLEQTADIIKGFGYVCHYRGRINVKGRESENPVPTYFVALDEDFNLKTRADKT